MNEMKRLVRRAAALLAAASFILPAALSAAAAEPAAEPEIPVETTVFARFPGDPVPLGARLFPDGAPAGTVWSAADALAATVEADGTVVPLRAGEFLITAETPDGARIETPVSVPAFLRGDADGNERILASDARFALRCAVGLETCEPDSRTFYACDADCDGRIVAADARLILRTSVGLETEIQLHRPVYGAPARVAPTCEEKGSLTRICAICGGKAVETLPATGHGFTDAAPDGQRICAFCGKTECEALGHDPVTSVLREATCTEAGQTQDVCSRCGHTVTAEIPAKGHVWRAATCTAPKTCTRCGATEGTVSGHAWRAATCTAPKTCTRCGATEGTALGHAWQDATCAAPKTCARCGAAEGAALGHVWRAATYCYAKTCSRCGGTEGDPVGRVIGFSAKGYPIAIVDSVAYVDDVLVANKTYGLPSDYAPGDLTDECRAAFRSMQNAASAKGLSIWVSSGYRSYSLQNSLYHRYAAADGYAAADRYSARPGHSEHQTGLAFDLNTITQSFADTAEGRWVAENCSKYGFILRYPKGKEAQTGYMYEPWHFRYVGVEKAEAITASGLCLEEYYGITSVYS